VLTDLRIRQRDYLLEIARAITARLDLDEVLRLIVEAAAEMLAGQVAFIALRDEEGFTIRAAHGLPATEWKALDALLASLPAQPEAGGGPRWSGRWLTCCASSGWRPSRPWPFP